MEYRLDTRKIEGLMSERGIKSVLELARQTQINRNTILAYFQGRKSPFTSTYTRLAEFFELKPTQLLCRHNQSIADQIICDINLKLFEKLKKRQFCLMLFGSRSRAFFKKYSDIDLGISGGSNLLSDDEYLSLCVEINELKDQYSIEVDFLNLDRADKTFLSSIRRDLKFIGGDRFSFAYFIGKIDGNENAKLPRSS